MAEGPVTPLGPARRQTVVFARPRLDGGDHLALTPAPVQARSESRRRHVIAPGSEQAADLPMTREARRMLIDSQPP